MLTIVAPRIDADPAALPCCSADPELFFSEYPADVDRAKELCADCPFRRECLEGAVARREPYGVWGGEFILHGVIVPRKRARGRPRKSHIAA